MRGQAHRDGTRSLLRVPDRSSAHQRGAAAAELAAVLPLSAAFLVAMVWMVVLAATQLRVVDAAREVARVAARADSRASAVGAGQRVAPEGARIEVSQRGAEVLVRVRAEIRGPGGLLAFLPGPTLEARAVSVREDR